MKKIINGKVYDTQTAKEVGRWQSSYPINDFHYYHEQLFQKKTGEFFLYGYGNAASPYRKSCGINEWCGGCKIIPINFQEAQKWAEDHLDDEEYCEIFGEPDEAAEDVLLGTRVSAIAADKLKKLSINTGRSQNKIIEELILDNKSAKQIVNSIFGKKPETRIERIRSMTAEDLGLFLERFLTKNLCFDLCPIARGVKDHPDIRCNGRNCDNCEYRESEDPDFFCGGQYCDNCENCEEKIRDWLNEEVKDGDIFAY